MIYMDQNIIKPLTTRIGDNFFLRQQRWTAAFNMLKCNNLVDR